ncbi:GH22915 [Drosophila grimshawi]|uniref:RNA helicase n=1 Tax=Drosophila grimshawi TaxID=7222 RepID=B4JVT9_DROGR|nr:GH22915 [Drosophila grimshawi]
MFLSDSNNNSDADSLYNEVHETLPPLTYHELPLLAANCSEYAVAHSNGNLQPARNMNEVCFLPHIQESMRRLRLVQLLRLQSYAWPHLGQGAGYGAVIVSAPKSGRTLSYVPPLCQLVCSELQVQRCRQHRWNLHGPIALVLGADLTRLRQIGALCNAMLRKGRNEEWLTLVLTVSSARSVEFFQRLLNGVGCLLATPAQFLWLCENNITLPSLRFVAYDDVDLMPGEQLQQAHKQLLGLVKQQAPQLVITTQSYKPQLLRMLHEFNAHRLLLFGDVLEAAIYGGARMRIDLLKREDKQQKLLHLLEQRPPHLLRTVINCQTDADICELVEMLEAHGYRCLPYYQTADLTVREHVHRWMQQTRGELLLRTDHCPELDIRHAHTLLHYSMSDTWSKFKFRHLTLADNLRNCFKDSQLEVKSKQGAERHLEQESLLSLVFLDESNNNQLPRLVNFLQMHQAVDERVVQLARQIRDEQERSKCNEPALCDLLLSLGDCKDRQCEQRHQLVPWDRQLCAQTPASGDVKLQLIRVYSPAHYCVRVLEHLPPGGNWQPVPHQATLELQLQLLQSQECVRHWPPVAKEICVYRNTNGYERVRILRVAPITQVNLSRTDIAVEVQAMDVDTRQFKTTSGKLYICPEQLRDKPALTIDLRILGLVPFTGERSWHAADGQQCGKWLDAVPQPNFLQASIVVSLMHTLFVQDLAATSYAPSLKMHVRRFTMCAQLKREQLAKKCELAIARLMEFLERDKDSQAVVEPEPVHPPSNVVKLDTMEPLTGRCGYFVKMAMQLGKENRLRQERQLLKQESTETKPAKPESVDSVEALYSCLMNCTLLELTEEQQKQPQSDVPQTLLNQIMLTDMELPELDQRPVTAAVQDKLEKVMTHGETHDIQYQMPANIRRPKVIYYQTRCTLELQIILPEAEMEYEAVLQNGSCIAFWTIAEPVYQFTLNTHCPYQQLSHHMQGRTVYLSILKTLAVIYPLDFGFYRFMHAHHEKLHLLEEARRARIANFEAHLLHKGYIKGRVIKRVNSSDELSSGDQDEDQSYDPRQEHVERARGNNELNSD